MLLAILMLGAASGAVRAAPSPERIAALRRGINLVHWFRFPPSTAAPALRDYAAPATLAALRRAGFTFVRVPVQPELLLDAAGRVDAARIALVVEALGRVEAAGLAAMPELHPVSWHLESSQADRDRLLAIWAALAPALRGLAPALTFPEILNEPVFPDAAPAWEALQARALAIVRAALPDDTVVLTGTDWGGIDGLLKAHPPADPDIVYAVHFYEPYLLAVGDPDDHAVDPQALGRLPFPADDAACRAAAAAAAGHTRDVMQYYCSLNYGDAALRQRLAPAADWSRRTQVPLVFNEFGINPRVNAASRLAWFSAVRRAIADDGFGWAVWGYDDSMGFDYPIEAAAANRKLPADLLHALGM